MNQVLGYDVQPTVVKERVLDVPAIDMTEPGVPAETASRVEPKATGRVNTKRRQPAKTQADKRKGSRDGSVGRETFAQVEALVKQGRNKSEAFKQVAEDTGRNTGTVAANYYRVARAGGTVKPHKARRKAVSSRSVSSRQAATQSATRGQAVTTSNGIDQIVGQLVESVQALAEAVKAQEAEVSELRGRLDGVRGLLAG